MLKPPKPLLSEGKAPLSLPPHAPEIESVVDEDSNSTSLGMNPDTQQSLEVHGDSAREQIGIVIPSLHADLSPATAPEEGESIQIAHGGLL